MKLMAGIATSPAEPITSVSEKTLHHDKIYSPSLDYKRNHLVAQLGFRDHYNQVPSLFGQV